MKDEKAAWLSSFILRPSKVSGTAHFSGHSWSVGTNQNLAVDMPLEQDLQFIRKSLELAKKGIGLASPNPLVGAVLVRDGVVVGEGFYTYEERMHAEVRAIAQAGERARGATLYINLEPCSHVGRTAPCAEAVIQAGITRVVACLRDPNPLVSGRGFDRLQAAGIPVDIGLGQEEALVLNEAFIKYITRKRPFVLLKAGMSLDGKLATKTGASRWITSEDARDYVQQLRWEYDAILVGVNTILQDNPELTVRIDKPKRRPLVKVIVDSKLRTSQHARVLNRADGGDVLIFTTERADLAERKTFEQRGITILVSPMKDQRVDLKFVCEELGKREITSLIIEGGSEVNWSAFEDGVVDKVLFIVAPKIIGGRESTSVVSGRGVESLSSSFRLERLRAFSLGADIAIEGYAANR
jgi:diaminohydroxyphosphoribosylaminopyrimidine deaminase/5-amino-6-(5-phosphoribosylamino)uracil reductase